MVKISKKKLQKKKIHFHIPQFFLSNFSRLQKNYQFCKLIFEKKNENIFFQNFLFNFLTFLHSSNFFPIFAFSKNIKINRIIFCWLNFLKNILIFHSNFQIPSKSCRSTQPATGTNWRWVSSSNDAPVGTFCRRICRRTWLFAYVSCLIIWLISHFPSHFQVVNKSEIRENDANL